MSERKVLNKYYPPDFDPSKIPRLRLPKNRQYTVRLMAPCNMKCKTCGEYIYKGKKFNARKETVENEEYLGIKIYRFYIKCPRCLAEITFKTDPENADYIVELGASRNFQALKLAEEAAMREENELKEEEKNNPMKLLENRTKASKREMESIEALEEIKDLNQRHAKVDYDSLLMRYQQEAINEVKRQEEEDEEFLRSLYYTADTGEKVKRIIDDNSDSQERKIHIEEALIFSAPPNKVQKSDVSSNKYDRTMANLKKSIIIKKKDGSDAVNMPDSTKVKSAEGNSQESTEKNSLPEKSPVNCTKSSALSLLGAYSGDDTDSN